jgi:hypothetical protein
MVKVGDRPGSHKKPNTLRLLWLSVRQILALFQYCGRAVGLVWTTSRALTVFLAILTLVAGLLPAVVAYISKLIIDGVVSASHSDLDRERRSKLLRIGGRCGRTTSR